jgi:uncharacterized membrane protein
MSSEESTALPPDAGADAADRDATSPESREAAGEAVPSLTPPNPVYAAAAVVFAAAGLVLSVSALLMYLGIGVAIGCGNQESCAVVHLPLLADHLLIPIPWLGVAGYAAILAVSIAYLLAAFRGPRRQFKPLRRKFYRRLVQRRALILIAVAFSIYFTAFQIVMVGSLCVTCLTSALIVLALAVLDLLERDPRRWLRLWAKHGSRSPLRDEIELTPRAAAKRVRKIRLSRATAIRLIATMAVILPAGAYGLGTVWNPLVAAEKRKNAYLDSLQPLPTEVGARVLPGDGGDPRPIVVFVYRDGCGYCTQLYGDTVHDPELQRELSRFRVLATEIAATDVGNPAVIDQLHFNIGGSGRVPIPSVFLVGYAPRGSRSPYDIKMIGNELITRDKLLGALRSIRSVPW